MSGAPNQRRMTQAEMAFTSVEAGKRAERRASLLERRLAVAEDRMAEQDRTISELASSLQDASDTISAFHVVLKELQEQTGKGVEQVLTGLDARVGEVEKFAGAGTSISQYVSETLAPRLQASEDRLSRIQDQLLENAQDREFLAGRIQALETKPRRGRPLGSKNKPKVENPPAEDGVNSPQGGDSSNSEASDA